LGQVRRPKKLNAKAQKSPKQVKKYCVPKIKMSICQMSANGSSYTPSSRLQVKGTGSQQKKQNKEKKKKNKKKTNFKAGVQSGVSVTTATTTNSAK